jgi:hypothetical protein
MKEKSNKQKCIEQWRWLRDNPGKSKMEYFKEVLGYDSKQLKECEEFWFCFACKEVADTYQNDFGCEYCPVTWKKDQSCIAPCADFDAPFRKWRDAKLTGNEGKLPSYANQIVVLIENTWKE